MEVWRNKGLEDCELNPTFVPLLQRGGQRGFERDGVYRSIGRGIKRDFKINFN
jgi:hypothetical protein